MKKSSTLLSIAMVAMMTFLALAPVMRAQATEALEEDGDGTIVIIEKWKDRFCLFGGARCYVYKEKYKD